MMSNNKNSLLPFNYLVTILLSYLVFWLLNILILRIMPGSLISFSIGALGLAIVFWSVWFVMYLRSDRPDKSELNSLAPKFFWISLPMSPMIFMFIVVFTAAIFNLGQDPLLVQGSYAFSVVAYYLWFWRWSYQRFYLYTEADIQAERAQHNQSEEDAPMSQEQVAQANNGHYLYQIKDRDIFTVMDEYLPYSLSKEASDYLLEQLDEPLLKWAGRVDVVNANRHNCACGSDVVERRRGSEDYGENSECSIYCNICGCSSYYRIKYYSSSSRSTVDQIALLLREAGAIQCDDVIYEFSEIDSVQFNWQEQVMGFLTDTRISEPRCFYMSWQDGENLLMQYELLDKHITIKLPNFPEH